MGDQSINSSMNKHNHIWIIAIIAVYSSCVKLPSEAPLLPELNGKVRLIHAASQLGNGLDSISVDGAMMAKLIFGGSSEYQTLDAGNRIFSLYHEAPETLFIDTDFVGSVYLANKESMDDNRFIKIRERWIYSSPIADPLVHLIVAQMVTDTLSVSFLGTTPWVLPFGSHRTISFSAEPGELIISAYGSPLDTLVYNFQGGMELTMVLMGTLNDFQVKWFEND